MSQKVADFPSHNRYLAVLLGLKNDKIHSAWLYSFHPFGIVFPLKQNGPICHKLPFGFTRDAKQRNVIDNN